MACSSDRTLLPVLAEPIGRSLALSDNQVGLIQGAAFGIAYTVAGIPLGGAIDRTSRRAILVAACALWIVAMLVCACAQDFMQLAFGRVLVGIASAAIPTAGIAWIVDAFPPGRRGVALSVFTIGFVAGAAIASVVGGAAHDGLAEANLAVPVFGPVAPWRAVHLAFLLPSVCCFAALLFLGEPTRVDHIAGDRPGLRSVLRDAPFLPLVIAATALLELVWNGGLIWASVIAVRQFGQSPSEFGLWAGPVILVTGLAGSWLGGISVNFDKARGSLHRGLASLPIVGLLCMAGACYGLAGGQVGFALLFGLLLLAGMAGSTASSANIAVLLPSDRRGTAVGLNIAVGAIFGLGLSPSIVPAIAAALDSGRGLGEAIAITGFIAAAIAVGLGLAGARRAARRPEAA